MKQEPFRGSSREISEDGVFVALWLPSFARATAGKLTADLAGYAIKKAIFEMTSILDFTICQREFRPQALAYIHPYYALIILDWC